MDERGMNLGLFRRWSVVVMVAFALQIPALALAEDESADLPARVGRVSDVAGELFLATQEHADEWAPIGLNYPVTSGDNLWVSANGRAEIDYGGGRFRACRRHQSAGQRARRSSTRAVRASGKVIVRVRSLEPGEVARIETPNTQIDIDRPGQYRIDVDAGQERTTLTVRAGEAGNSFRRRRAADTAGAGRNCYGYRRCGAGNSERIWQRRLRYVERGARPAI